MPIDIKEKIGATRLKNTLKARGRKTAITGIQAGQAPKKIPINDPITPPLTIFVEQQDATFLL
jgi:hypothetical protein